MKYINLKCGECGEVNDIPCDGDSPLFCPDCQAIDNFEDDIEDDPEELCSNCAGTGDGLYAMGQCSHCNGSGMIYELNCRCCNNRFSSGNKEQESCSKKCNLELKAEFNGDI